MGFSVLSVSWVINDKGFEWFVKRAVYRLLNLEISSFTVDIFKSQWILLLVTYFRLEFLKDFDITMPACVHNRRVINFFSLSVNEIIFRMFLLEQDLRRTWRVLTRGSNEDTEAEEQRGKPILRKLCVLLIHAFHLSHIYVASLEHKAA